ncbi:MAG TPA: hypothetical protein VGD29_00940 [Actinoplanes sp.]
MRTAAGAAAAVAGVIDWDPAEPGDPFYDTGFLAWFTVPFMDDSRAQTRGFPSRRTAPGAGQRDVRPGAAMGSRTREISTPTRPGGYPVTGLRGTWSLRRGRRPQESEGHAESAAAPSGERGRRR